MLHAVGLSDGPTLTLLVWITEWCTTQFNFLLCIEGGSLRDLQLLDCLGYELTDYNSIADYFFVCYV